MTSKALYNIHFYNHLPNYCYLLAFFYIYTGEIQISLKSIDYKKDMKYDKITEKHLLN